MKRLNSYAIFAAFLCMGIVATATITAAAQEFTGTITGIVVNTQGRSVAGAWVTVGCGNRPLGGRVPGALSDERGHFVVNSLELTECVVSACKVQDDIPCPPFFGPDYPVQVTLTAAIPTATVQVRLGEKGTVITGTVKDAITGENLEAGLVLHPLKSPNEGMSMSSRPEIRIFIYPLTDYSLEISAPGYKTWSYAKQHPWHKALRLAPRAHLYLDVKLNPTH